MKYEMTFRLATCDFQITLTINCESTWPGLKKKSGLTPQDYMSGLYKAVVSSVATVHWSQQGEESGE